MKNSATPENDRSISVPIIYWAFLLLFNLYSCAAAKVVVPPTASDGPPAGTILTVILQLKPMADTLELFRVIRGPGRLREDYAWSATLPEGKGYLLYSFLDAEERILRQVILPFPGPVNYEVADEDGTIQRGVLPDEERSISLRTQDNGRLSWLKITGTDEDGRYVNQRFSLVNHK